MLQDRLLFLAGEGDLDLLLRRYGRGDLDLDRERDLEWDLPRRNLLIKMLLEKKYQTIDVLSFLFFFFLAFTEIIQVICNYLKARDIKNFTYYAFLIALAVLYLTNFTYHVQQIETKTMFFSVVCSAHKYQDVLMGKSQSHAIFFCLERLKLQGLLLFVSSTVNAWR